MTIREFDPRIIRFMHALGTTYNPPTYKHQVHVNTMIYVTDHNGQRVWMIHPTDIPTAHVTPMAVERLLWTKNAPIVIADDDEKGEAALGALLDKLHFTDAVAFFDEWCSCILRGSPEIKSVKHPEEPDLDGAPIIEDQLWQ